MIKKIDIILLLTNIKYKGEYYIDFDNIVFDIKTNESSPVEVYLIIQIPVYDTLKW